MAKVILKRIWRSGFVCATVLVGVGSVGGGEVHSDSHQPRNPGDDIGARCEFPAARAAELSRRESHYNGIGIHNWQIVLSVLEPIQSWCQTPSKSTGEATGESTGISS